MTAEILHVINKEDRVIEIFINDNEEVFFGEVDPENEPHVSWMAFSYEDWLAIKQFVDKQFTQ
jgi:hypothetical protein